MVFHFLAGVKFMNSTSHCFKFQGCRTSYLNPRYITRRSRGIHAAWHFWYAVGFGGESGLRKVGLYGIPPLTQR